MSIKTRALALGAAVALLATSAAAQPVTAKKRSSAVRTVTRMLTGVYLTTYTSGSVTGASAQSTVHLCGAGASADLELERLHGHRRPVVVRPPVGRR